MTTEAERLAQELDNHESQDWSDVSALLRSQAAEIERLQLAVALKNGVIKTLQDEANDARLEIERKDALLRQELEFLEFCWRDVSMNEYSFDKLNERIDAIKTHLGEV